MRNISGLALPLLLISIFGFLLQKRGAYKGTLITYALLAIGLAALFILFYEHYLLGLIQPIADTDKAGAEELLTGALFEATDFKGFVAFNIFIDLFLCTLVMFFMDYTPKRVFTGKKIIIFRSFVILPALYEIICIYLKIMLTNHLIALPLWVSPFLTTKPPISMIMFFSIIRYIKTQEKRYLKTGRTLEQYDDYCKTNIHSFRFSKHLIIIILAYAILDAISVIFLASIHLVLVDGIMNSAELTLESMTRAMEIVSEWGFGETASMIELIPVVLLFSYTRTHKSPLIDKIIPIVGVILIVFVYFEGAFLVLQDWLGYAAGELKFVIGAMEMSGGL